MHLVGYLYEDYHNARSLEHKSSSSQALENFYQTIQRHIQESLRTKR